jgi:hypothetical protein
LCCYFSCARKKSNQKKAPCHEPFGFVCASEQWSGVPELAPLSAGLKQPACLVALSSDAQPRDKWEMTKQYPLYLLATLFIYEFVTFYATNLKIKKIIFSC